MTQQNFADGASGLAARTTINENADDAELRLQALEAKGDAGYLGIFADAAALNLAYPPATTTAGSTATVTSPSGNLYFLDSGGPSWVDTGTGFLGDMLKSVYDPTNQTADAFSMGSMAETASAKVYSDTERAKLAGVQAGAKKNSIFTQYNPGVTVDPSTTADSPGAAAPLAEMTHTFTPADANNEIEVFFGGSFENSNKKNGVRCAIFIDGAIQEETIRRQNCENNSQSQSSLSAFWRGTLSVALHTVQVRFWGTDDTTTAIGVERNFSIKEVDES